jgi:chemotaxis protein CheD
MIVPNSESAKKHAIVNVFIKPGEFFVSKEPVAVKTILGSCVSVCLHDKVNKVGAMNHLVHPNRRPNVDMPKSFIAEDGVSDIIKRALSMGADRKHLVAKIVGGSNSIGSRSVAVGLKNVEIVRKVLTEEGIKISKEHTGGDKGRKALFYPYTGELFVNVLGETSFKNEEVEVHGKNYIVLDDVQKMCFDKIFTFAVSEVARVLSELVNKKTTLTVYDLAIHKMSYVQEFLSKEFSDCLIESGELAQGPFGETLLMLPRQKASVLINHLLERDLDTNVHFNDIEESVILEVANILTNGLLGSLANVFECKLTMRPHTFVYEKEHMSKLKFMNTDMGWKGCLILKTKIETPGIDLTSNMFFLIELNSIYKLFENL